MGSSPIGSRVKWQVAVLFGAEEEKVNLIGEGVTRVAFEERLKGTFCVAFEAEGEVAVSLEGAHEAGLAHTARANDGNDVCHLRQL